MTPRALSRTREEGSGPDGADEWDELVTRSSGARAAREVLPLPR